MPHIRVNDSRIEYLERGRGEPVVLLHSTGKSSKQWGVLVERLGADRHVLAPDLYGYGESSPWPGRTEFSLADEAAIVHALLDRLDQPAHLVGHSYGGAVALHVARVRGDMLRSLTLIEPIAFHLLRDGDEDDRAALHEVIQVAEIVARALATGDRFAGFERFVDYWAGAGSWAAVPTLKRVGMAASVAKVALDYHATIHSPLRLRDFENIKLPTLLMAGGATTRPTHRICKLLARSLRNVSVEVVDGAGHMLPLTHRKVVNNLIVTHLAAQDSQRCTGGSLQTPCASGPAAPMHRSE